MGLLIGDVLASAAATRPRATAATLGAEHVTFAAADERADRTASALAGLGVGRGDVVAWWSGTSLRCLDGFIAAARLGAVFAPVSPLLGVAEGAAVIGYLRPRLLVADAPLAEQAALAAADLDLALAVVGAGRTAPGADLDRLTATAAPLRPIGPDRAPRDDDPHIAYLTSGTTGRPKGVLVGHRASWLRSFPGGGTFTLGLRGDGGILTSFPLFHYGGWHYVLEAWHSRCAVHLVARADAPSLLAAVERWRPTGMYCIPAVWARVLDAADGSVDFGSVRHADTGTSATPLEFLLRIRDRIPGATTSVFYGSTEAGHHTTLADWDLTRKPASVGRAAPPAVVRLAPDGEICVSGPTLMSGYLRLPEDTAAALDDGWYHTGDLGQLDDEGYLWVTGRKREVIRSGGETVSPVEVEAELLALPGVSEAAVVGVPDERWGELVCAAVVMADGAPAPDVEEVRRRLADRLASYKHPRRVVAVPAIPRTAATGQVQRTLLRESLALAGDRGGTAPAPPDGAWNRKEGS